ncbi:hypothetical protein BB559_006029 [Furculomyces boomerangus]|uniref:Uncharacterized protein n=2 Tax=Harpellales TaxID=61421 RepID=A0A2T9Y1A2_9FUNG|nr:hypothetical protein BB559_006669 [Furculomyces boomerangus]PVU87517.1 hypothetical protein BB559_006029 [Furculomyces boomerangus]PWA00386.1 hypothetical protein BB558_003569 [Smittium angustum]
MDIKGKVAIVTGGAQGIGRGMTLALLKKGASVVVADLRDAQAMVDKINKVHGSKIAVYQRCDVSSSADCQATIDRAISEFGKFDILVNNAGIGGSYLWDEHDRRQIEKVIDVDLTSVIDFTRLSVQHWEKDSNATGAVVNVASNMAFFPAAYGAVYGAAKAGVVHFTATCASLFPKVRVNAVAPNYADTDMFNKPASKKSDPHQIAKMNGVLSVSQVVENMIRCIEDKNLVGDTIKLIANKQPLVHKQRKAAKL